MLKRSCTVIIMIFLLACIVYTADSYDRKLQREKEYQQLQQVYKAKREELVEEVAEEIPVEEPVVEEVVLEPEQIYCEPVIDFAGLKEENEDIYAWITVPGTEIDYPVLQCEEDNYYLERNIDHSEGYPGCIYTNQCNAKDFSDALTVLYGHNMKNGSMFAGLHKFEDADFFDTYDQILVYTEEARYTYQIYVAAAYSDGYLPTLFDVTSKETPVEFDSSVKEYKDTRKLLREEVLVTEEDRLLTLSTCISREATKRYLVVGRLVETAIYYK